MTTYQVYIGQDDTFRTQVSDSHCLYRGGHPPQSPFLKGDIRDPADNAARDEAADLGKGFKYTAFGRSDVCVDVWVGRLQ